MGWLDKLLCRAGSERQRSSDQGRNHVFKVGVQFLGLGYCTEQNTDGIPSLVHCSSGPLDPPPPGGCALGSDDESLIAARRRWCELIAQLVLSDRRRQVSGRRATATVRRRPAAAVYTDHSHSVAHTHAAAASIRLRPQRPVEAARQIAAGPDAKEDTWWVESTMVCPMFLWTLYTE